MRRRHIQVAGELDQAVCEITEISPSKEVTRPVVRRLVSRRSGNPIGKVLRLVLFEILLPHEKRFEHPLTIVRRSELRRAERIGRASSVVD